MARLTKKQKAIIFKGLDRSSLIATQVILCLATLFTQCVCDNSSKNPPQSPVNTTNPPNTDQPDTTKDEQIAAAQAQGLNQLVNILNQLKQGNKANINQQDPNKSNQTALHQAIALDRRDIIDLLLKSGANKELKDEDGNTPLHLATKKNKHHIIDLLLNDPVDVNIKNINNDTPLDLAINKNSKEVIQLLLKKSPELISRKNKFGFTLLTEAISENKPDIVNLLLQAGAKVEEKDGQDQIPLLLAVEKYIDTYKGDLSLVTSLLQAGARPDTKAEILMDDGSLEEHSPLSLAEYLRDNTLHAGIKQEYQVLIDLLDKSK